nr:hypothetical protein [Neobacillus sp. Marseille-Q6967]
MHFRHVLISGLMVGAAILLPDQAFAEKNEIRGQQQKPETISVQSETISTPSQVPVQADNGQQQEKTMVPAVTGAKGKAPVVTPSNAETPKPVQEPQKLPEQAKVNDNAAVLKAEKVTGLEKAAAVQKRAKDIQMNKQLPKNTADSDRIVSLQNTVNVGENKTSSSGSEYAKTGSLDSTESIEETLAAVSSNPQEVPNGKEEEIPKANQVMNQTQRTSGSGGKSNDRTGLGQGTMNLMDKIFEWDPYDDLLLVEIYFSRQEFMIHQWVNAPPLPPPQAAPFFKK